MKNFKKIASMVVAGLLTLGLAACNGGSEEDFGNTPYVSAVDVTDEPYAEVSDPTLENSSNVDGDPAVWRILDEEVILEDSTRFMAQVTRLGCSGGVTGHVNTPTIEYGEAGIVVTFTVESLGDGAFTCPDNDEVPVLVELSEPVGSRVVVDGNCIIGTPADCTSFCFNAVRWDGEKSTGFGETPPEHCTNW